MATILTIGHSDHTPERFLELLEDAGAEMVVDVRTNPVSVRHRHFAKTALTALLRSAGLTYFYLGHELGGRPADATHYTDGVADYERMAEAAPFRAALERVIVESDWLRLVLMCAEKDPRRCHRSLLIARALSARGIAVHHILGDGGMLTHAALEDEWAGADQLFASRQERLAAAYREQARGVAFKR